MNEATLRAVVDRELALYVELEEAAIEWHLRHTYTVGDERLHAAVTSLMETR